MSAWEIQNPSETQTMVASLARSDGLWIDYYVEPDGVIPTSGPVEWERWTLKWLPEGQM